jgi:hypothetical protein
VAGRDLSRWYFWAGTRLGPCGYLEPRRSLRPACHAHAGEQLPNTHTRATTHLPVHGTPGSAGDPGTRPGVGELARSRRRATLRS